MSYLFEQVPTLMAKKVNKHPASNKHPPPKKKYIIVNTQYEFTCRPVFFILCFVHDQCTYLKCVTENDENLSSPHPKVQKLITILFSPGGHWIMVAKLIQTSRHFTLLPDCKFKHQDNQALIWIQNNDSILKSSYLQNLISSTCHDFTQLVNYCKKASTLE